MLRSGPNPPLLGFAELEDRSPFVHGVFTRLGGVSQPPYDSLNVSLSVGDDPASVSENRRRSAAAMQTHNYRQVVCHQMGGNEVAVVDAAGPPEPIQADALVTKCPGVVLSMTFADCLPIILTDPTVPVVSLVHAGWRGTVGGIALRAWEVMRRCGARPQSTTAYLGPAISPCCYEVGEDVAALARRLGPAGEASLETRRGRLYLDLPGLNAALLEGRGVRVVRSNLCTACRRDLFFSHRGDAGRTGRFAVYAGVA
ncbi:MAG: peptidoglycan editing factor PgeF [Anaerolineae bacterium]|nr:peptidoglycan editing factor PgeF [Anaerolineae bacterium]